MSTGASAAPGTPSWYDLVREDVVDPDLPIIDPHHHLWPDGEGMHYGIADLRRRTTATSSSRPCSSSAEPRIAPTATPSWPRR
ncbi:MAG: hypothetical protein R2713_10895 [Ilumatobacteraceae bacterium]